MLRSNLAMMRFRVLFVTLLTSKLLNSQLLDHQPSEISPANVEVQMPCHNQGRDNCLHIRLICRTAKREGLLVGIELALSHHLANYGQVAIGVGSQFCFCGIRGFDALFLSACWT